MDSRDIAARIRQLEDERQGLLYDIEEAPDGQAAARRSEDLEAFDAEYGEELRDLKALEAERPTEWQYGATFIRESYFRQYAEDLANDIGAIDSDIRWPLNHIDWSAAADDLRMDYSEYEIRGSTYLTNG